MPADAIDAAQETFDTSPVIDDVPGVDLFKLAHHGSRANMTDALLDLIDPAAILICTDGSKFHHPDEDALDKVRAHYPTVPIHFTDDTELIRLRAAAVGTHPPEILPLQLDLGTTP